MEYGMFMVSRMKGMVTGISMGYGMEHGTLGEIWMPRGYGMWDLESGIRASHLLSSPSSSFL